MDDLKGLMEMLRRASQNGNVRIGVAKIDANDDDDDDNNNRRRLTDEQIETRLTEYYAQVFVPEAEEFTPGDIIFHKNPGLADIKGADQPHIFLDHLETTIYPWMNATDPQKFGTSAAAQVLNSRIGCIVDQAFVTYLSNTRIWTKTRPRKRN